MLQLEDHVYHALLWKKPRERYHYLKTCFDNDEAKLSRALSLMKDLDYPKLYNTNLARYGVFLDGNPEPTALFYRRQDAMCFILSQGDICRASVVDIPVVELEKPRYSEYYTEEFVFYETDQTVINQLDDQVSFDAPALSPINTPQTNTN
jgi:hypothetical protein